jgi:small subunit ribosomal protein S17
MMSEETTNNDATEIADSGHDDSVRHRKERVGVVVKANAEHTVVVQVSRRVTHPKYPKTINRRKRYAAHDELGVAVGDYVTIRETRPMSKTKRWRVVGRTAKQT